MQFFVMLYRLRNPLGTFLAIGGFTLILPCVALSQSAAEVPPTLRIGVAGHAFDHLGGIPDQGEVAAASGANIIYATGVGSLGYTGLPAWMELERQRLATANYLNGVRKSGIKLALGYVCATSIVKLNQFDTNWPAEFRAQFSTAPAKWLQVDRQGKPLASWYGGDYLPACMNNPDWRKYERFMVRQQLEAGCDGIFFDNPTVHPEGCYCDACMESFFHFLVEQGSPELPPAGDLEAARVYADRHPSSFLRFRCTIARDFIQDMRAAAREFKPAALITANNSLNSPDAFFVQCRSFGYNISEMSKTEDFVVVEDMASLPRTLPGGRTIEYAPTLQMLKAISHGKPVVAVAIAEADYHTPPHLTRLAMAEAAANQASHLWWPTWPENQRTRMAETIRPEAEFLRAHAGLLNDTQSRRDVVVFLPFQQWLKTNYCSAARLTARLSEANIPYQVLSEDGLLDTNALSGARFVLGGSTNDFNGAQLETVRQFQSHGGKFITADGPDWFARLCDQIGRPSFMIIAPATVRATVADQKQQTVVQLLNLDVKQLSSYDDEVTPARDLKISVTVPRSEVRSVRVLTADPEATAGDLNFTATKEGQVTRVEFAVPRLDLSALAVIE